MSKRGLEPSLSPETGKKQRLEEGEIIEIGIGGEELVGEKTVCKAVFFCCDENRTLSFGDVSKSVTCCAIRSENITYCIARNHEHLDTDHHFYLRFPLENTVITFLELQVFLAITCESKMTISRYWAINYLHILWLLEYFQMPIEISMDLKQWLKDVKLPFVHSISALSVYEITNNKKQPMHDESMATGLYPLIGILNEVQFPLLFRLTYLCHHNGANIIVESSPMSKEHVSKALDVEVQLLDFLDERKCVLTGGGATKLGCPKSKFTLTSDVDFFILNGPFQEVILYQMLYFLRSSGRHIFLTGSGKSVYSAIGKYGVRRIQLILASETTAMELISTFDVQTVRAFYDGVLFQSTAGALYDWQTMKCSATTYYNVPARRLYSMTLKGFEIDEAAQVFLKNTIKWPDVSQEVKEECEFNIPFLVCELEVPLNVQFANLRRQRNLTHCTTDQEEVKIEQFVRVLYGCKTNVYCGPLEKYSDFCRVDKKDDGKVNRKYADAPCYFYWLQCDFVIELRGCLVEPNDCYLKNVDLELHKAITKNIPEKIFAKWEKDKDGAALKTKSSIVPLMSTCKFFLNGLAVKKDKLPTEAFIARALIQPSHFYEGKTYLSGKGDVRLRWKVCELYWTDF